MKKIFVVLMSFAFFVAACNNNKAGKNQNLKNREKDDYGNRDNNNREDDDGNKWSAGDRNKYTSQCLDEASSKGINDELAAKICSCSLEKTEKKFSSYADADGTSSNASVIANFIKECAVEVSGNNGNTNNTEGWSQADENKFMDECESEARKNVPAARANQYCDCMLQKTKRRFSSYLEADRGLLQMQEDELKSWTNECNGN
ncbi:MAG TPA: hypothetical protein VK483_14390 [Chitinophagaceae bacterium]|nr:hypothetical protein [Chitinophagaceae bacterium]